MNSNTLILASIALIASANVLAAPTLPERPSQDRILGWCEENGGVWWPAGPESANYGCLLPDGTLVLCEGSKCDVFEKEEQLPTGKVPLAAVPVIQQIQTQEEVSQLKSKLDLLQVQVDDLADLVEDVCEPPDFY